MVRGNVDHRFWAGQYPRWAGAAAMLGGALCVLAAVLHNLEPVGCIGMDCETSALRSATGFVPVAAAAASLLILVGMAGLTLLARQSRHYLKLANAGLMTAAVGFILLFTGGLIQAAFFAGDFPGMPYLVVPGLLAVIAGLLMIGVFILRSGVLPRWLGIVFVVSTVALLAANEQTPAVLLAVPFGLAMVASGYYMWAGAAAVRPPQPETAG